MNYDNFSKSFYHNELYSLPANPQGIAPQYVREVVAENLQKCSMTKKKKEEPKMEKGIVRMGYERPVLKGETFTPTLTDLWNLTKANPDAGKAYGTMPFPEKKAPSPIAQKTKALLNDPKFALPAAALYALAPDPIPGPVDDAAVGVKAASTTVKAAKPWIKRVLNPRGNLVEKAEASLVGKGAKEGAEEIAKNPKARKFISEKGGKEVAGHVLEPAAKNVKNPWVKEKLKGAITFLSGAGLGMQTAPTSAPAPTPLPQSQGQRESSFRRTGFRGNI